jgi:DNA polymerase-3 subunit epsilon
MAAMSDVNPSGGWWVDPGFVAFDTETTGTDPGKDRIVTAALVHFRHGAPVSTREWLIRLDIPIPAASTEVHGITDEHSRLHGIDESAALTEIHDHIVTLGLPIVAFNATFDVAMLNANLARLRIPTIDNTPVLCPYVIDKQFDKYVKGSNQRRLMPTIQRYGLAFDDGDWHGAAADATITGRLFLAQLDKYDSLGDYTPESLSANTAAWRDQQEAEFQAWLARKRAEEFGRT